MLIWRPLSANLFLFISRFSATAVLRSASSALPIARTAKSNIHSRPHHRPFFEQLQLLQAAFRGDVVPKGSAADFQIRASKEYGASYALLELAKELGLDRLSTRARSLGTGCLAMIVGRVIYAGSKLALSNQWKNTALWDCPAWKAKSMSTSIVICRWIGSWTPQRDSAHFGGSSSPGWSSRALPHQQQLL